MRVRMNIERCSLKKEDTPTLRYCNKRTYGYRRAKLPREKVDNGLLITLVPKVL